MPDEGDDEAAALTAPKASARRTPIEMDRMRDMGVMSSERGWTADSGVLTNVGRPALV